MPAGQGGGTASQLLVHEPAVTGWHDSMQGWVGSQTARTHPATDAHGVTEPPGSPQVALPPLHAQPGTWPHAGPAGPQTSASGAQWWNWMSTQSAQPPVGSHEGQQSSS